MLRTRQLVALALACLCFFPFSTFAQQETATITGTVTDSTGAIVPRATVIATNVQTNVATRTQTDDAGRT